MLGPDADIILAYHHQINTHDLEVTTEWVKGHQDEKEPTSALSNDAQLNTKMDESAGHERLHGEIYYEEPYPGRRDAHH